MSASRVDQILRMGHSCYHDKHDLILYDYAGYYGNMVHFIARKWLGDRPSIQVPAAEIIVAIGDYPEESFVEYYDRLLKLTDEREIAEREAAEEHRRSQADPLDNFFDDVMAALPHGSGIDYDWRVVKHRNGIVWFRNGYHFMNDVGMYDGAFDFYVSYSYDLVTRTVKFRRLWTDITEWMVSGECGECDGRHEWSCKSCHGHGIQFGDGYERYNCEDCNGTGDIVCPECNEEGLVEYDDLPSLKDYLDQCFWEPINVAQ